MHPFLERITEALQRAHVPADLAAEDYAPDASGDAVITFRSDPLLLRFTRRGAQEFLEISCSLAPGQFYWFGDIEVAMGWGTLEKILSSPDLPPLQDVTNRLGQHLPDLKKIFFKSLELFTQTSIQRTMRRAQPDIKPVVRRLS